MLPSTICHLSLPRHRHSRAGKYGLKERGSVDGGAGADLPADRNVPVLRGTLALTERQPASSDHILRFEEYEPEHICNKRSELQHACGAAVTNQLYLPPDLLGPMSCSVRAVLL